MSKRIIFIGGGNMAEAIFSSLDTQNNQIYVTQRNKDKLKRLQNQYPNITFNETLDFTATEDDFIILSVKPQDSKEACLAIKEQIKNANIITVMSGITTDTLANWLDAKSISRAMPNSPATLKLGVTGLFFNSHVSTITKEFIKNIFTTIGSTYIFNDEDFIDKITATGGSAPAYVYFLMEQMIATAINTFNFNEIDAKQMTLDVFKGAIAMVNSHPEMEISQLRQQVTSKKGTTDAAIKVFETNNFQEIVANAMVACYNRAKELSFQNS